MSIKHYNQGGGYVTGYLTINTVIREWAMYTILTQVCLVLYSIHETEKVSKND